MWKNWFFLNKKELLRIQIILDITMYQEHELQMATTLLEHIQGQKQPTAEKTRKCWWKMHKRYCPHSVVFDKVITDVLYEE